GRVSNAPRSSSCLTGDVTDQYHPCYYLVPPSAIVVSPGVADVLAPSFPFAARAAGQRLRPVQRFGEKGRLRHGLSAARGERHYGDAAHAAAHLRVHRADRRL